MKPVQQLFRHDPANGSIGDCHRCAIASILEVAAEEVPHFGATTWGDGAAFTMAFDEWLIGRGFKMVTVAYYDDLPLDECLRLWSTGANDVYYILGVQSRRGGNHSVVGLNGKVVHDPHPDGQGDVPYRSIDGVWQISVLVPLRFTARW
jgi:hypothetical protein